MIAVYVCGLISFAFGRAVNGLLFRRKTLENQLLGAIKHQRLNGSVVQHYEGTWTKELKDPPLSRLYTRLWQHIAEKHPNSAALRHLSRYWAMAATYDGLAVSLLTWSFALGKWAPSSSETIVVIGALVLGAIGCFHQGAKYYKFQIEDLVAALAVMGSPIDWRQPVPESRVRSSTGSPGSG